MRIQVDQAKLVGLGHWLVKLTVLFYGVHKDGDTLAQILDKETFAGVLVSVDAAVYQGFTKAQKCWAHLIRKAIKLTLQDPANEVYRQFTDQLVDIYRRAKRVASDGRLGDAGRFARVGELDDEILELGCARWLDDDASGTETEAGPGTVRVRVGDGRGWQQ